VVLLAGLGTLALALGGLTASAPGGLRCQGRGFFGVATGYPGAHGVSMYLCLSADDRGAESHDCAAAAFLPRITRPSCLPRSSGARRLDAREARAHDAGHHRRALIFYSVIWLMLLAGVPWGYGPGFASEEEAGTAVPARFF